jgi:putative flippase GtrA
MSDDQKMGSKNNKIDIQEPKRVARYILAGLVNTVFGLCLYPALMFVFNLRDYYLFTLFISQVICISFAFTNYKIFVFKTSGSLLLEFIKFSPVYLISYSFTWIAVPIMVEKFGIDPVYAQLLSAAVVMSSSYIWHNRFTFRGPGLK